MSLFEVGRLAVKIAGRDAGRKCVIVESLDNTYVLVDGDVRRKKVNVKHLELLDKVLEIKKSASHEEVKKEFEKLKLAVWEKKSKDTKERSKKQKKVKEKVEVKAPKKKTAKKEMKKEEQPPVEEAKTSVEEAIEIAEEKQ